MSGLVKAKKYDWKDSNMALFGSDTEKQVKKESAESEPAWQGAGQEVGLKIWRIVKFEVTEWPEEDYGKFYGGDSYIVLNTYKKDEDAERLDYDLHFWIGNASTQDEYCTVAYKTVELDTFLDDAAIQHREVHGQESEKFRSLFPGGIEVMEGGAESGFRHVEPEEYKPRLLLFSGKGTNISVKEVPLSQSRLTPNDVFILDMGLQIIQWNGSESSPFERNKAATYCQKLEGEHSGASAETVDQDSISQSHMFHQTLVDEDEEDMTNDTGNGSKGLYKVSDADGSIGFEKIKEPGDISMEDLDPADVFVLDAGCECFVWVGSNASPTEKHNGFGYAHRHLVGTNHCLVPITVIKEGQQCPEFENAMAA